MLMSMHGDHNAPHCTNKRHEQGMCFANTLRGRLRIHYVSEKFRKQSDGFCRCVHHSQSRSAPHIFSLFELFPTLTDQGQATKKNTQLHTTAVWVKLLKSKNTISKSQGYAVV